MVWRKFWMRPGLSHQLIIPASINAEMSGQSQHRTKRTVVAKYYAGECDYSEWLFHPVSGEARSVFDRGITRLYKIRKVQTPYYRTSKILNHEGLIRCVSYYCESSSCFWDCPRWTKCWRWYLFWLSLFWHDCSKNAEACRQEAVWHENAFFHASTNNMSTLKVGQDGISQQ